MRSSHYELSSVWKQQNRISAGAAIKRSQSLKNSNQQVFVRNETKRRSLLGVTSSLPVSMLEDDTPNTRRSKHRFTRRSSSKPLLPEKPNEVAMEGVLLPGECVVSQVDNVTHVGPYKRMESGMRQSIRGTLFSTNFRLIFLSSEGQRPDSLQLNNENYWRNVPDFFSLPLGNIHTFSAAAKGSSEFKQLSKQVKTLKVPEEILITCKDCKRVRFVLSGGPSSDKKVWQIKQFFQGTMHHMQPLDVTKLFAVDLGRLWKPVIQPRGEVKVPSFEDICDWDNEIQRLKLVSWRVSAVNSKFELTPTLPPYLVCPFMVSDKMLVQASKFYRLGRLPTLSHSTRDGCLLMRSAYLLPDVSGHDQVALSLLEHNYVSSCPSSDPTSPLDNPERAEYQRVDVGEDLASLPQIQSSYLRMMEAVHEEERWMSSVESTRWLEIVSDCLDEAARVAERLIQQKKHVLLLEPEGRDLTALISTLVQLLCDPESRTLIGFESLIQREWVAYGHPFCSRFKHTTETAEEEDIGFCPVFFLLLDCTWQIMRQFPASFDFNSQYLLMLAQEVCSCVSSTFLFDCIQHKQECLEALKSNNNTAFLYPFWQLRRMVYPTEQSESTLNPLFCLRQAIRSNRDMYSLIEECLGVFSSHKGTECGLKRAVSLHSLNLLSPKRGPIVGSKSCGIMNKVLISALSDNVMFQSLDDTLFPETDLMHIHVWKDFFVSTTWDLDNSSQIYTNMVERETQKLVKRILNLYHNATELQSLIPNSTPTPEIPGQRIEILSQTSSEVSSARDSSLDMFNDSNSNLSSSNSCNMNEIGRPTINYIIRPTTSFIRAKTPKIMLDKDMTRSPYLNRRSSRDHSCNKIPFLELTECAEAMYRLKQNVGMEIMCLGMKVTKEEFAEV